MQYATSARGLDADVAKKITARHTKQRQQNPRPAVNYQITKNTASSCYWTQPPHTQMYSDTHFEHAFPSEDTPHDSSLSQLQYQAPAKPGQIKVSETRYSQLNQIPVNEFNSEPGHTIALANHPDDSHDPHPGLGPPSRGSHSAHPAINSYFRPPIESPMIYSALQYSTPNYTTPLSAHSSPHNRAPECGTCNISQSPHNPGEAHHTAPKDLGALQPSSSHSLRF